MLKIELDQRQIQKEERLSKALLLKVEKALAAELSEAPDGTVAVSMISEKEMQALNRQHRGKDKVTDVLSFSYLDDGNKETIGDVVISADQARRQAKKSLKNELITLVVHGILHILGYDHETKKDERIMFPLQDKIVEHIL